MFPVPFQSVNPWSILPGWVQGGAKNKTIPSGLRNRKQKRKRQQRRQIFDSQRKFEKIIALVPDLHLIRKVPSNRKYLEIQFLLRKEVKF